MRGKVAKICICAGWVRLFSFQRAVFKTAVISSWRFFCKINGLGVDDPGVEDA